MPDIHRIAIVAALVAAGGCARDRTAAPAHEPSQASAQPAPTRSSARAHAPAGTDFSVTMNERITSSTALPGMTFTATVQKPISSSDGGVLVKQGATLRGRVVAIDRGEAPSMKIAFDSIETVDGTAPVATRVVEADEYGFTLGRFDYDPDVVGYDSVLYPGRLSPGVGGGPTEGSEQMVNEIVLPTGGELRLVLTRPLWEPLAPRER